MAKKKKKNQHSPNPNPELKARVPFLTPRRSAALCLVTLLALWLVQFFGVLAGSVNLWEDVIQLGYPAHVFARMAILGGEFPHWNPFSFGGMPFFGTGAGILYPVSALTQLLPLSDAATWRLIQTVIVLHVLVAGFCMFAYLRFKGRTCSASLFGAVAFMFGGYIITHIIHSGLFYIAAWMPLMLILLEKGVRGMLPRYAVMGGLLLGAVMQAGHPQVMFYAIVFMLTYGVYFILRPVSSPPAAADLLPQSGAISAGGAAALPRKFAIQLPPGNILAKRAIIAALFFATGAGLCFVQYLPVFEAAGQTARINFTLHDASEGSLQFVQLLTALLPKLFGAYTGQEGVPVFWLQDAYRHGYYNYWETCFYFGVSTLILSVFIFRRIRTDGSVMMAAGWILLSLLVALGGNFFFYKLLFSMGIPGFNSFRHVPRILFIWGFLFPVLAAAVLDSLDDLRTKRSKIVILSLCGAAAALGIITIAGGLTAVFPLMNVEQGRAQYASQQGIFLLVNALLLGAVLILFFTGKIRVSTAKLLLIVCLAADMLTFAAGQHITKRDGANIVFNRTKAQVEQIKSMRKDEIFRVNTRQFIMKSPMGEQGTSVMERNQGYVSGIETTEGYHPFRLKYASLPLNADKFGTLLDLLNVRHYVNPHRDFQQKDEDQATILTNDTRLPRAKLFYKAKVIGGSDEGNSGANIDSLIIDYMNSRLYDHRNEVVVTAKELSKFTGGAGGPGKVQITKYKNNRIELDVDADREAILWLSEIWYPAWKAAVNGNKTEVYRANYSFRAIVVPPGQSKVVFKFESAAFNAGVVISLLTLIFALGYLFMGRVTRKKTPVKA
ncbi:MAG: YfhO family protein [Chitinispirillia bacterium]|nr:YfhO family protein [Chitinispirillia bacterium]MCL2241642.1 YfhO family protein [Chitinispirillia bacterium]